MTLPTDQRERQLRRAGFRFIAGADEAGRGAWAGPIVAAAVILPATFRSPLIRDSKQLSPAARELAYREICRSAIAWAVCSLPATQIDRIGIQRANLSAITRAIARLSPRADMALIDAWNISLPIPSEGIIRGDQSSISIAAASILAKVSRDRALRSLSRTFPTYGFAQHKGYGTTGHQRALNQHGASAVHRHSFAPVARVSTSVVRKRRALVNR